MTKCVCGRNLVFQQPSDKRTSFGGWCHEWPPGSGRPGSIYWIRCAREEGGCGWEGAPWPSPIHCPRCGEKTVVDDHCASPDRSAEVGQIPT